MHQASRVGIMSRQKVLRVSAVLAAATGMLSVGTASVFGKGAAYLWNAGSADWNTGGDWTGGSGAPGNTATDAATIDNAGTVSLNSVAGLPTAGGTVASIVVGGSISGTLNINAGGSVKASALILGNTANSTGSITMTGGTLGGGTLASSIGNSGTGTFTQTAGIFGDTGNTGAISLGVNAGSSGTYNLSGTGSVTAGSLSIGVLGTGAMTMSTGTTATIGASGITIGGGDTGAGNGTLTMTGGHITSTSNTTYVGANSAGGQAVFTISGGQVDFTQITVGLRAAGGRFNIVGSAAVINANYFYDNHGTTAVYLDNGGVSTINAPAGSILEGTLIAGFKGGAALMANSSFTLINAGSNTITDDFVTKPNANWTAGRDPGLHTYTLALASGVTNKAALSATAGGESSFAAVGFGHLTITNVATGAPLLLYLNASAGSSTLSNLVAYFNSNGLTASQVSPAGTDFDIQLTFATPSAATQYFGWDLGDFNSTATISGVGVLIPEPTSLCSIGLGTMLMIRRRRRRVA